MFSLIWNYAKSNAITILSKVNIKNIAKGVETVIDKSAKKINETKTVEFDGKKVKEPNWQRKFPFTFFFGGGKFQPLYFWIFSFCTLALAMLFVKIYAAWKAIKTGTYDSEMISTADLGVVLGFISSLILLYNNGKKNKVNKEEEAS
jgi:hypothetical protein